MNLKKTNTVGFLAWRCNKCARVIWAVGRVNLFDLASAAAVAGAPKGSRIYL